MNEDHLVPSTSPVADTDDLSAPLRARARRWHPPAVPTLVVAPHPDDDVLVVGGLVALQRQRGVAIHVVAVTDGGAAYPAVDRRAMARIRRREQETALAELNVAPSATTRLELPDGDLARHEDELATCLDELATGYGLLVAPWTLDHHSDHEACGRAALQVATNRSVDLAGSIFWGWHHPPAGGIPTDRLRGLPLSAELQRRRAAALRHHHSQLSTRFGPPVLNYSNLVPHRWTAEYYIV